MSELTARLTAVKAFLAEYPAVFVFGSLLIAYIVVKLRAQINKSKRSVQQSGRPIGRATLGSNTDADRGAQFVHDVRRTQWLEAQQKKYEEEAAQKIEQERIRKQLAAQLASEEAKR